MVGKCRALGYLRVLSSKLVELQRERRAEIALIDCDPFVLAVEKELVDDCFNLSWRLSGLVVRYVH